MLEEEDKEKVEEYSYTLGVLEELLDKAAREGPGSVSITKTGNNSWTVVTK